MSATAAPAPNPAPELPEVAILRAALAWARERRIRVEPAAPPVECASSHGTTRWVRRYPDAIVDPIGAAILRRQPQALHLVAATVETLFTTIPMAEGIADGLSGDPPSRSWMGSAQSRTYGAGFIAGVELRAQLTTTRCSVHGIVIDRGTNCPICVRSLA